jgi:hypothetical protein
VGDFRLARSSLVLTVDRLNPSFLGPYGGTWASTPNFNRLAVRSLLLENSITDAVDLLAVMRSYWQGVHAMASVEATQRPSLAARLRSADVRTVLITDDPTVAQYALADSFAECIQLPTSPGVSVAAEVEETELMQSLAAMLDVFSELRSPFHLWVHLRGMAGPWDAPLELRESVRGDDDPPPYAEATPPALRLAYDFDPDGLIAVTQAYAAQMLVLDMGLGVLLETIEAHPARGDLLFLLTSPRGYPLGEHLVVGDCEPALYGELLHTPLFLQHAGGIGALLREQALSQPGDIAATLADWHGIAREADSPQASSLLSLLADHPAPWPREQTLTLAGNERATRTPAWFLRRSVTSSELDQPREVVEVYSKPDDRFEANEIASRVPQIAEQLLAAQKSYEHALVANDFTQLTPLAVELSGVGV